MEDPIPLRDRHVDTKAASTSHTQVQDDQGLGRVGKKQILKRRFGFLSILGFSCTILASWEGILSTFVISFEEYVAHLDDILPEWHLTKADRTVEARPEPCIAFWLSGWAPFRPSSHCRS